MNPEPHEPAGSVAPLPAAAPPAMETVPISAEQAKAWKPSDTELKTFIDRNVNLAFAATAPLPGPASDAFASDGTTRIHGFTLLPLTGGHIAILTALQSPFLTAIRLTMAKALAKSDEEKAALDEQARDIAVTIEDMAAVMFVFTRPPADSRSILAQNKPGFLAIALSEILDKLPPFPNLDFLGAQIGEHYARSFVTSLNFAAAENETGKGASINFPPAPSRKTALAG